MWAAVIGRAHLGWLSQSQAPALDLCGATINIYDPRAQPKKDTASADFIASVKTIYARKTSIMNAII